MANAILDFGPGYSSTFTCSTQLLWRQKVNLVGTRGRVELDVPFNAPPDKRCRIRHELDGKTEEIDIPLCNQYGLQGEVFARAILDDTPVPTPLADAVRNMRVIEAIRDSAASGCWANVSQ
jgi:predicted dehydrogenase